MNPTAAAYSARFETNSLADSGINPDDIDHSRTVQLSDPQLVKILRLRVLTDRGFPYWDVSYVYGQMADGSKVRVDLGVYQFSKEVGLTKGIVQCAKDAGRYAKGLGMLDAVSTLR